MTDDKTYTEDEIIELTDEFEELSDWLIERAGKLFPNYRYIEYKYRSGDHITFSHYWAGDDEDFDVKISELVNLDEEAVAARLAEERRVRLEEEAARVRAQRDAQIAAARKLLAEVEAEGDAK